MWGQSHLLCRTDLRMVPLLIMKIMFQLWCESYPKSKGRFSAGSMWGLYDLC